MKTSGTTGNPAEFCAGKRGGGDLAVRFSVVAVPIEAQLVASFFWRFFLTFVLLDRAKALNRAVAETVRPR